MNTLYPTPPERVTEFFIKLYDEKQAIAEYLMRQYILPDIDCAYDIISEIESQILSEAFDTDNEIDFEFISIISNEYGIPTEYVSYFITSYFIAIL